MIYYYSGHAASTSMANSEGLLSITLRVAPDNLIKLSFGLLEKVTEQTLVTLFLMVEF